jgi:acetyltransferase-like isoleucine patch superfamily enzyme
VALSEHFRQGPLRSVAERLGDALVFPAVVALRARLVAFTTVSHALALVPGVLGRLLRRAWYRQTLMACGRNLVVHFGAAIRTQRSRVGDNCTIGIYNWFGWVDIGDDFMSGSHVVVLSGRRQHRFDRLDIPMRAQGGEQSCVSIGNDVWVGAGVVIGADVAPHTIVASGAVVQKKFDDFDILGGVPSKPIGSRRSSQPPVVTE